MSVPVNLRRLIKLTRLFRLFLFTKPVYLSNKSLETPSELETRFNSCNFPQLFRLGEQSVNLLSNVRGSNPD